MTTRQRQAPGGATVSVANGTDAGLERTAHFAWEEWFRHASSQQRADALGLAQQQGLVYPHQLPPISNGVKPTSAIKEADASPLFARLLAGKAEGLPRLHSEPLSFFDADLDDVQRLAVLRALATPDLFLLQGLPGTGKSRVVAEIVRQAATRGWRVLCLAGQPASLDVVLHRLVDCPEIFPLRFLDTVEKLETLPAWLQGLTLDEQKHAFLKRVLAGARANHQQAESACNERRDLEPLWTGLQTLAQRIRELDGRLQALKTQLPHIDEVVQREAEALNTDSAFSAGMAELQHAHDEAAGKIDTRLRTEQDALRETERALAELAAKIAQREPGYRAKKSGRFWTMAYWTNLFNGQIILETESLMVERTKLQVGRDEISRQIEQRTEQQNQCREQFVQERADRLDREIQARTQALLGDQQTLEDEARMLDEQWTALCGRLDAGTLEKTPEAIVSAQEVWLGKKKNDEQQCLFAHQWTKFVEESGPALATKLPSFANVLAASVLRWHTDAKLREAVATPFDLLIVEDAETLTEADLLKLSRQAHRCTLVAQALAEATPAPTVAEKASRVLLAAPLVSAVCFGRLWQTLGGDAGRWPCAWQREHDRLVCQLMPLTADDRQHLESEGLADAPHIELRILHRPRTQPCLAEVIFAPEGSFADAFTFMMREVQEFPLQTLGRTGWWSECPQHHHRHLGPNSAPIGVWLEIEPGLRLGAVADEHGDATRVARIEFDKAAGWERAKAEAWLHRHRPLQDHERTVFLQTPHRFERPLARMVEGVVRTQEWLCLGLPEGSGAEKCLEFVAVPPLQRRDWPREGSGLELDLSASRQADRLPVGLRQGLPARGFVNFLEAQALIRRLENWMQKECGGVSCRVAVLALYEGQVELLRRLVEQSEILRSRRFALEVALPSRLHQRECDIVFLSLTRSHAHRCVAFGEDVKELPLALTRSRSRLVVFGDPGSLVKRTHWHGPLEHLDANAAQQELVRLSRLLAYLQKQGHGLPRSNGKGS